MTTVSPGLSSRQKVQVNTFHLLWCEGCGHADQSPLRQSMPDFVAPTPEPMRCNDCGELLHLIECFTAPESTMWQRSPGNPWHHVIYHEALPDRSGRQIWIDR